MKKTVVVPESKQTKYFCDFCESECQCSCYICNKDLCYGHAYNHDYINDDDYLCTNCYNLPKDQLITHHESKLIKNFVKQFDDKIIYNTIHYNNNDNLCFDIKTKVGTVTIAPDTGEIHAKTNQIINIVSKLLK